MGFTFFRGTGATKTVFPRGGGGGFGGKKGKETSLSGRVELAGVIKRPDGTFLCGALECRGQRSKAGLDAAGAERDREVRSATIEQGSRPSVGKGAM